MITWRPIAELPDELKDGREVLLWDEDGAETCIWHGAAWMHTAGGVFVYDATHFAEINAPEETPLKHFEAFCAAEGLALDDPQAQLRWLLEHGQQQLPDAPEGEGRWKN